MVENVIHSNPLVSVLMPVYNGELYLNEAIKSILQQTYSNFEFLIINDGSTDKSEHIVQSFNDPRIVYVNNEQNMGLIKTLNKGLDLVKGTYIARMDCDDISLPLRIEKQISFLENNTSYGLCGTQFCSLKNGKLLRKSLPCTNEDLKSWLLFKSPIAHPTVMLRSDVIKNNNFQYSQEFPSAEDFHLWTEFAKISKLANLPDVLLLYRIHRHQITQRLISEKENSKLKNILHYFEYIGIVPTSEQIEMHNLISDGKSKGEIEFLKNVNQWFVKIIEFNNDHQKLDNTSLEKVLSVKWAMVCGNSGLGLKAWSIFKSSYFSIKCGTKVRLKLWIKIMLKHKKY